MAFVEEAHLNDIGTVFRVTVYDTSSTGTTTVAKLVEQAQNNLLSKDLVAQLLLKWLFLQRTVLMGR